MFCPVSQIPVRRQKRHRIVKTGFFVTLVISTLVITHHVEHLDMINDYLSLSHTDSTGSLNELTSAPEN